MCWVKEEVKEWDKSAKWSFKRSEKRRESGGYLWICLWVLWESWLQVTVYVFHLFLSLCQATCYDYSWLYSFVPSVLDVWKPRNSKEAKLPFYESQSLIGHPGEGCTLKLCDDVFLSKEINKDLLWSVTHGFDSGKWL